MDKGKILLIDDDQDMVSIGEQIFLKAGYEFFSAEDGETGLRVMLEIRPDLVLLDYLLPDMKGEQFLAEVSDQGKYAAVRSTPFVILTAWEEEPRNLQTLYEKGLQAYLTKPFGHRELRSIVENLIQLHRVGYHLDHEQRQAWSSLKSDCTDLVNSIIGLSKSILDGLDGELDEQTRTEITAVYNTGKLLDKKLKSR